jgi:hypothetical protein
MSVKKRKKEKKICKLRKIPASMPITSSKHAVLNPWNNTIVGTARAFTQYSIPFASFPADSFLPSSYQENHEHWRVVGPSVVGLKLLPRKNKNKNNE